MTSYAQRPNKSGLAPHKFGTEHRRDIQGIRTIAVTLVLLFHAGVPGFSGGFVGVDVFFVVSGYLITGIVARELDSTGSISLRTFYAKRILRIVPAATVVLVAVAIATLLWLPITRWLSTAKELIGSAVYISNWQFAASTNYLNAGLPASPLQHFWSLAVEEQYYLLWPALLALGCFAFKKRATPRRAAGAAAIRYAWALMLVLTVSSFVFAVLLMQTHPEPAYFVTPARLWELGAGSLLALSVPYLRHLGLAASRTLFISGLLLVLGAGTLFDSATPFPGATALVPVVGASALIASGIGKGAAQRSHWLLGSRPFVWIGDNSYALYLWHWPILIIGQQGFGLSSPLASYLLVASAIVPAYLSTRFLEKPIARNQKLRSHTKRPFQIGLAAVLCSVLACGAILGALRWSIQPQSDLNLDQVGAASITIGSPPTVPNSVPRDLLPSLIEAKQDIPVVYDDGCHLEVDDISPVECAYGPAGAPTLLLVGDSHAAQWFSAVERYANENHLRLVSMTKSSCPFADVTVELTNRDRPYTECATWNQEIRQYIEATSPIAVVTASLGIYVDAEHPDDAQAFQEGLQRSWQWLSASGIQTYVIADSPYMSVDVPECLASALNKPRDCATSRDEAFPRKGLETRAAANLPSIHVLDVNDKICPGETCSPIIDSVLVYRDQHHMTDTYVRTLYGALEEEFAAAG